MLDQEYIFSVKLTVPDSAHNFKVGNFMVHLALVSEKNRTLADVSRPALLQYKSPLLRSMQTVLRVFPLIFNYASEVQSIQVSMLDGYQEQEVRIFT
jgi:seipin